ncbi:MAG: hypothetical protein KDA41_14630 [Planctomycetales bacterium]|nr:hypothetical protein [Planctomycetales bacterium]
MQYAVPCQCGHRVEVSATQAGATVKCTCGASLDVPTLSQLRRSAGQASYEAGVIDTIRRMIDEQSLPSMSACVLCGRPTSETLMVQVQCETKYIKGFSAGPWKWIFVIGSVLFLPFWWVWLLVGHSILRERREEFGRDVSVRIPLRVDERCRESLQSTANRRLLRELLDIEPIYSRLLDEYPQAHVSARLEPTHD